MHSHLYLLKLISHESFCVNDRPALHIILFYSHCW